MQKVCEPPFRLAFNATILAFQYTIISNDLTSYFSLSQEEHIFYYRNLMPGGKKCMKMRKLERRQLYILFIYV